MGLLIKQGEIVTATERYVADLYADDGRVLAIGPNLERRSAKDEVLDASGRFVFPGFVDPHVHLALPVGGTVSADDFETGTASGVAGGTTTIVDFVVPDRGQSLLEALRTRREQAKGSVADYTFHMGITGWDERTAGEMRAVVAEHGIPSFKVLMAYKGTLMVDDGELYQVMKHAARLGAVVLVHAENGDAVAALQQDLRARGDLGPEFHPVSRPSCLEGEATHRALVLAKLHGTEVYIVHMTCREAVEALARARAAGERCYGETCPQYLLLDDTVFAKPDFEAAAYVCSPPIRPAGRGHHEALWKRAGRRRAGHGRHRPLPVHHGAETPGPGRFHEDPGRPAGDRGPAPAALHLRRVRGPLRPAAHGGARQHEPGPHLRALPAQGRDRGRQRRRPGALRPEPARRCAARRPTTRSATATPTRASP